MLVGHRLTGKVAKPNGADIAFIGQTSEGFFYCKDDRDNRPIRATEMVVTRLAGHMGILTPYCAVIDDGIGRTYFGSFALNSPAGQFDLRDALSNPRLSEIGSPDPWLGSYLSTVYAFDLAFSNPDRSLQNFLMDTADRQVRAFDFASADLKSVGTDRFFVEHTKTLSVGRALRAIHGFDLDAALGMVRCIEAIPVVAFRRFISDLPRNWLPHGEGERLCDDWERRRHARLAALSAGLRDGSLL